MPRTPTGGRRGNPPKAIEEKRRLGNPGRRPLPKRGTLVALPAAKVTPDPPRPLGPAGREVWDRVWDCGATWLARDVDVWAVLVLCEQVDERQGLRARVLRDGDWRERAGLRAIDAQVMAGLAAIGFTPVDRTRMAVAEVAEPSKLEKLLAERTTGRRSG